MAVNPIPLGPGMDNSTRDNAINSNFQQIQAENRTKVIKDESGVQRILLGRDPKGNYVLAISKPGIDVVDALSK